MVIVTTCDGAVPLTSAFTLMLGVYTQLLLEHVMLLGQEVAVVLRYPATHALYAVLDAQRISLSPLHGSLQEYELPLCTHTAVGDSAVQLEPMTEHERPQPFVPDAVVPQGVNEAETLHDEGVQQLCGAG
mgnify:CR=1 FL=1